jgi:hypothetical protein
VKSFFDIGVDHFLSGFLWSFRKFISTFRLAFEEKAAEITRRLRHPQTPRHDAMTNYTHSPPPIAIIGGMSVR